MKKSLLFLVGALVLAYGARAQPLFGPQIQNVQDYSTSPFWHPGGPYNMQIVPTPIFVGGPQLNAAQCQVAVHSAIRTQCQFRNNCRGLRAEDIRPGVIAELASRPGANYVGACAGFINPVFDEFMRQNPAPAGFPAPTRPLAPTPQPVMAGAFGQYAQMPQHELDRLARQRQLEALQQQTTPTPTLVAAQMPMTFDDLPFTERMALIHEGWQHPAVGQYNMFPNIGVETDAAMFERQANEARLRTQALQAQSEAQMHQDRMSMGLTDEFCAEHPRHPDCVRRQTLIDEDTDRKRQAIIDANQRLAAEEPARLEAEVAAGESARTAAQREFRDALMQLLTRE
jgi:hypothetical protein